MTCPWSQSYPYLDNRFMQFAHGRCLADELDALRAPASLPAQVGWPAGFRDVYATARPGGDRPAKFDAIAELGGDTPQRNYPLRNVGEFNFQIKVNDSADSFGEMTQGQALREAYPGAVYLHMARKYEVAAWHTGAFSVYPSQADGAEPFHTPVHHDMDKCVAHEVGSHRWAHGEK